MSDYDSTAFYVFSDRGALLQQGISAGCGQYAVYQIIMNSVMILTSCFQHYRKSKSRTFSNKDKLMPLDQATLDTRSIHFRPMLLFRDFLFSEGIEREHV